MSPLCRLKRADAEGYRITEPREKLTPPRREIYASGGGGATCGAHKRGTYYLTLEKS